MTLLEYIKLCLRISNDEFDEEINALIEGAKQDLITSGVASSSLNDYICKQAIELYCKANFGFDNTERDAFNSAYLALRTKCVLALNEDSANAI